jgi:chorismate mutase
MTACEPAEALAPPAIVSDMASLDALVIVAAKRLILGADVAAAKFVKGQEIEDPVREREILDRVAGKLNGAESGHGIGMAFFRDQIEASKVIQRALHARLREHPRESPVSCRGLIEEIRPELDLVNRRMLALLTQLNQTARTSRGRIDGLFDRQLRANASLRPCGELRRNAADVAMRSLYRP